MSKRYYLFASVAAIAATAGAQVYNSSYKASVRKCVRTVVGICIADRHPENQTLVVGLIQILVYLCGQIAELFVGRRRRRIKCRSG